MFLPRESQGRGSLVGFRLWGRTELDTTEATLQQQQQQVNNAKKYRKTIEWERLEISSKISDTKGTFHAKMGIIKDIKSKDLTEAEEIKKG